MGPDAVCTIYTDAAGSRRCVASLGDLYRQGSWPKVAMRGGIDWKELRVLTEALSNWRTQVMRKLVLVKRDNAVAVASANHGAGRSSLSTRLARETKEAAISVECTVVALQIAGK